MGESKEKCEIIISKFNGKYLHNVSGGSQAAEPLLCKFADGGPKKNKHQGTKGGFIGGRVWRDDGTHAAHHAAMINFDTPNGLPPTGRLMVQSLPNHPAAYQVPSTPTMWVQPPSYMVPPHIPAGGVFSPVDGHSIHLQQQHLGGITAQMNQLQLQPATAQQQQQFSIQQQQQRVIATPATPNNGGGTPVATQQQQQVQEVENESNASSDPSQ